MRLNKYIALHGSFSRREADKLIFAGKVEVNNIKVDSPAIDVCNNDKVKVDGKLLIIQKDFLYYKFYKPKYCLTSYGDEFDRKNLNDFELLKETKPAYSGRLDFDSEGLILFSNNGDLIYRLQRPEFKISKVYLVKTDKNLTDEQIVKFRKGFKTDEEIYKSCKLYQLNDKFYRVVLFEGKNRQIRKMFEYFGINVLGLKRVAIGPVKLQYMKPGEVLKMSKNEIEELNKCIGLE